MNFIPVAQDTEETMLVIVSPYDPKWPSQFDSIKAELQNLLDSHTPRIEYVSIEHVGSTSIPEMPAKPQIDIDIVIPDVVVTADGVNGPLQDTIDALAHTGGYVYLGDRGIPDRHAFRYTEYVEQHRDRSIKSSSLSVAADDLAEVEEFGSTKHFERNVYVCLERSLALRNHRALRDICRSDARVRECYAQTKLNLANREWSSVDKYCEAKNEVISWILQQAGMSSIDVNQIRKVNELANIAS